MRIVPADLSIRLADGVTTLCRCWRLIRRDGVVLGFTEHDADLVVAGTLCRAGTALTASEATAAAGFAIGGGELSGAFSADAIDAADLDAGLYDGAWVETWIVDWTTPAARMLVGRAMIGEVERRDGAFRAEIRGLSHQLDKPRGRVFRHGCDAELGDARCGVDLDLPGRRGSGFIATPSGGRTLRVTGMTGFAEGVFRDGTVLFTSGPNTGLQGYVKDHEDEFGEVLLELWEAMPRPVQPGNAVVLTVGCDKRFATCREKFSNGERFRGFPHMPGTDFALAHPARRTGRGRGGAPLVP